LSSFKLNTNEVLLWSGRESVWDSSAIILMLFGVFLVLAGILLSGAQILAIIGFIIAAFGFLLTKRFSIYHITNRRIVEVKRGRVVREVRLDDIVKPVGLDVGKLIEGVLDVSALILTGRASGFIPSLLGINSLNVRNARGEVVFTFRRVKVKEVREKLVRVLEDTLKS